MRFYLGVIQLYKKNMNEHLQDIANTIFNYFDQYGDQPYFGEAVSQLQHACQAAERADTEGYDDDVIIAAFLHDIGHLCVEADAHNQMEGYGTIDHERIGAHYLREKGFSDTVCRLVAAHVPAKRYLTYVDEMYYNNLSDASKQTLQFQGGRMSPDEAQTFEEDPLFPLYIQMRLWDEAAKQPDIEPFDLSNMKARVVAHLKRHHAETV